MSVRTHKCVGDVPRMLSCLIGPNTTMMQAIGCPPSEVSIEHSGCLDITTIDH